VRVENGHLVIEVNVEGKHLTSVQLISKYAWAFGKLKARAKIPKRKHLWPAIWMMSQKSVYGQWFVLKVNFKEALILLIISKTYL
jgi:beta-glucanase (GH16 family)